MACTNGLLLSDPINSIKDLLVCSGGVTWLKRDQARSHGQRKADGDYASDGHEHLGTKGLLVLT